MTSLSKLVEEVGCQAIPFAIEHKGAMKRWLNTHGALFSKVCENKPDTAPALHLLGLLTKSHIEASSSYEQSANAIQQMQETLSETIGDEHASKFTNQAAEDLILITHLWLYTQGYLNMDFSLAHDHAQQTQTTLQHELAIKRIDKNSFRSELMQSFYLGREANPIKAQGIWGRLKNLLSL